MSRFQTLSDDGYINTFNDTCDVIINTSKPKHDPYKTKLLAVQTFFGVSGECAAYLYYRRKRGFPWKLPGDNKYLEWTIQLQNAIILLDTINGFKWSCLEFGFEDIQFMKYNIDVRLMPKTPSILKNDDEFKVVVNKHNNTKLLNKMGLLPKSYIMK